MENNLHPRILQSLNLYVMYARLLQSYLTLCDPMECRPPGSSVHRILQGRIMEWVAIPFSKGSSRPRDQTQVFYHQESPVILWCKMVFYICMYVYLMFIPGSWHRAPRNFLRVRVSLAIPMSFFPLYLSVY